MPEARVELAFLEFQQPDLEASVRALMAQGCNRIKVLPMFMAPGGHLKRDLPHIMARFEASWPGVRFELAAAVGTAEPVLAAMAGHAADLLRD
jgi:sirohydrochlorin cobaltochelatase